MVFPEDALLDNERADVSPRFAHRGRGPPENLGRWMNKPVWWMGLREVVRFGADRRPTMHATKALPQPTWVTCSSWLLPITCVGFICWLRVSQICRVCSNNADSDVA